VAFGSPTRPLLLFAHLLLVEVLEMLKPSRTLEHGHDLITSEPELMEQDRLEKAAKLMRKAYELQPSRRFLLESPRVVRPIVARID
jgi:hypothetical protein